VAQAFDPATGKTVLDTLWGPARDQGYVAGLNMTGKPTSYRKEFAFNVTRLAGLTTTIIGGVGRGEDQDLLGIARGDSETWRQFPDAIAAQSDFEVNRLRMMVGVRSLLGAVVMGDQTLSQAIQHLVKRQVDISPVRERLLHANGSLGDVLAEFWARWKGSYAASSKT
jgi:NADPH-dependent 2,4-dienoyl-CoA reductase/sulfur reductase-like enzyme